MDLPFLNNAATPSTRQPSAAISIGGGADSGGLGGAIGGLAEAAGVSLSSDNVDPWLRSLVSIQSESSLAPVVDQLKIQVAQDSQAPDFAIEDEGNIQLGFADDELHTVFTGLVNFVQIDLTNKATITLTNGAHILSQFRLNESFEQQAAGDIVSSLANSAGVETNNIEPGIDFPFYVIDDSKNLYQHIAELADKCGFIAYMDTENKLNFTALSASPAVKTFTYGVDILAAKSLKTKHSVDQVSVVGQGAAGSQGSDAWNWLAKDVSPVSGSAGSGANVRVIADHSIRSAEAAQQAAASRSFLLKQKASSIRITVAGSAEVAVGSRVEITAIPNESLNGAGVVASVRHQYSKLLGFTSELVIYLDSDDNPMDLLGGLGGLF